MSNIDDSTRCTHTTADGRRCRMPRVNSHVSLCGTHLEAQHRRIRSLPAQSMHDALSGVTDLNSATAVKHVLGNLAALLIDGRIDHKRATALANICQLILHAINMANNERWDAAPAPGSQAPPVPLPPVTPVSHS